MTDEERQLLLLLAKRAFAGDYSRDASLALQLVTDIEHAAEMDRIAKGMTDEE